MRIVAALFSALLLLVPGAPAWNATGHEVIAAIAYDHLKPSTRTRVDDLIRRHPDYQPIFLKGAPSGDSAARARYAFIKASTWADAIRNDPRFYNEDQRNAKKPPLLPGFPDMGRHTMWHYINRPFTQDGTKLAPIETPNALTELERLSSALAKPVNSTSNPVYALPWVIHIAGDIHNPLHTVSRFSKVHPQGDRGGNLVLTEPGRNLHSYWDGLVGPDPSNVAYVDRVAKELGSGEPQGTRGPYSSWISEGVSRAKSVVYTFGPTSAGERKPIHLSREYRNGAKQLSKQLVTDAGLRLGTLLNEYLP
jgi:hypothetical protein